MTWQQRSNLACKGACSDWMPPCPSHFHRWEKFLPCVAKIWLTKRGCSWRSLLIFVYPKTYWQIARCVACDGWWNSMSWAKCWSQQVHGTFESSASTWLSCSLHTKTKVTALQTFPAWMPQGGSQGPWTKKSKLTSNVAYRTKSRPKPCTAPWVKNIYVPPLLFFFSGAFVVLCSLVSLLNVLVFSGFCFGKGFYRAILQDSAKAFCAIVHPACCLRCSLYRLKHKFTFKTGEPKRSKKMTDSDQGWNKLRNDVWTCCARAFQSPSVIVRDCSGWCLAGMSWISPCLSAAYVWACLWFWCACVALLCGRAVSRAAAQSRCGAACAL